MVMKKMVMKHRDNLNGAFPSPVPHHQYLITSTSSPASIT
jgi:hypothetical protein